MPPTTRVRRIAAALAVPALLFTAACGSEESTGPVASVSGKPGEEPEITIDKEAGVSEQTVSEVLAEGDGATVEKGDFIRLDVVAKTVSDGEAVLDTWASSGEPREQVVAQAGVESYLPKTLTDPLVGERVGSRVTVEGLASEMFGDAAEDTFSEGEGLVWVIDIAATLSVDLTAEAEGEQAAVREGMPEVEAGGQKAATITIPEDQDPPGELRQQVLIEGDGAEVEAGQAVAVQYTGVLWKNGEKFDSSWDRDSASAFQIGTEQVVKGWDVGLVGKHVGDRVLLVLPPDMAYGEEGNDSIPANATLVFVVDIIGAA